MKTQSGEFGECNITPPPKKKNTIRWNMIQPYSHQTIDLQLEQTLLPFQSTFSFQGTSMALASEARDAPTGPALHAMLRWLWWLWWLQVKSHLDLWDFVQNIAMKCNEQYDTGCWCTLEHSPCPMHQQKQKKVELICNWRPFHEFSLRSSLQSQTSRWWLSLYRLAFRRYLGNIGILMKPCDLVCFGGCNSDPAKPSTSWQKSATPCSCCSKAVFSSIWL